MNKIICDICGTTYQSSADSCPICGFSNNEGEDFINIDVNLDLEDTLEEPRSKSGRFSMGSRKKEIFDFDEVNSDEEYADDDEDDEEDEDDDYDEAEEEEEPRHNVIVVILLTVLIVVLLGAAAFIFFRFFLPNMSDKTPAETTSVVIEETTLPATEAVIPCQQMVMTNSGVAELNSEGQQFLLHVKALPENTTDSIIYTSGDESIATVTEDGKITAVSEGETVIHISCGEYYIGCPVIVEYVEETVPPTTAAVEEETVPYAEIDEVDANAEETYAEESQVQETNGDFSDATKNVTLKLKKTDIRLGVYYEFRLELDCDLDPEEVIWSSEHEHIAKVDEQGNVTAVKEGTTSITAKYGDQEVQCIVRCGWY